MTFDNRQGDRKRILERIMLAAQVLMVLYLATHAGITYQAYDIDGLVAAVLTFVLLGFGDLYWGLRWAYEGDARPQAAVALVAAAVCFTSWATRGMFNRWMMSFTVDMLEDFSKEMDRMSREIDERETGDGEDEQGGQTERGGADSESGGGGGAGA